MVALKINKFLTIFLSVLISPHLNYFAIAKTDKSEIEYKYKNEYIVDSGDSLYIKFNGLAFLSTSYIINQDGYLYLPEIGNFYASGKTLAEIKEELLLKYEEYIKDPDLEVFVSQYRPVKVTLNGEINKIGLFELTYTKIPSGINTNLGSGNGNSFFGGPYNVDNLVNSGDQLPPRLFDLIQLGMGVTSNADLANIEVLRKNSNSQGGGKVKTTLNLISLIRNGDQSQNIILRDGDHVFIPRSEKVMLQQLIDINKSNLTPNTIKVFINGNVPNTGIQEFEQGISLHQALAAVGGVQSLSGSIEFIRLTNEGKVTKNKYQIKNKDPIGGRNNPILVNGDIIFVRRNLIGKLTAINEYTSPVINAYGVYKIFD